MYYEEKYTPHHKCINFSLYALIIELGENEGNEEEDMLVTNQPIEMDTKKP